MRISLQTDLKSLTKRLSDAPAKVGRASVIALNRAAVTVRKEGANLLSEAVQPRRKTDIKEAIEITRATTATRQAVVTIKERHLPLDKVKGVRVSSFRRGRRRVQRITYRGRILRGAFRPTNLFAGNRGIVTQASGTYSTGHRRVRRLYAFSLLQEAEKSRILRDLERIARARFKIELSRSLKIV